MKSKTKLVDPSTIDTHVLTVDEFINKGEGAPIISNNDINPFKINKPKTDYKWSSISKISSKKKYQIGIVVQSNIHEALKIIKSETNLSMNEFVNKAIKKEINKYIADNNITIS